MIVICHHYKYLKLIKRKAIKLFPQPERCKRIKVCNTSKIVSLDSKITAWFSWLVIAFKLRLAVVVNVIITITYQVFRSLYKPATVPIFELYTVTFKNIFYSHQKYAYNQVQGKDIHKSTCKTFVWRAMRTYPHRTHQMMMWHLHLLVPHQVFSFLWQQHRTLPASHLSQHH